MWWYGRGNSGGSWLLEEKKANMWPGRGNSGGSWPPALPRSWYKVLFQTGSRLSRLHITGLLYPIYMIPLKYDQ